MAEFHLSEKQLLSLIHDDETIDVTCVNHLDDCNRCQCRIEALSANQWMWEHSRKIVQSTLEIREESKAYFGNLQSEQTRGGSWSNQNVIDLLHPPSHPELLGRLDHYDVESIIGRGGAGIVFKAVDTELRRPIAIKMLLPHLAGHGPSRKRFLREARAAAAIRHPHVVEIYQIKAEAPNPYLVMELILGNSIQEEIDSLGPMAEMELVQYSLQIAEGLAAAHSRGLVHRDIKPANILLEPEGRRALITDFGLARTIDEASLTCTGLIAGTPHYMSPEQCHGRHTNASSDLFSLGCLMYFMCSGRPPFRGEGPMAVMHRICTDLPRDVREINPDVSASLAKLISRLLEKSPSKRFESASETADVLRKQLASLQDPIGVAYVARKPTGAKTMPWKAIIWSLMLISLIYWSENIAWNSWIHPSATPTVKSLDEYLTINRPSLTLSRELWKAPTSSAHWPQVNDEIEVYRELLTKATNDLGEGHLVVAEIHERIGKLYLATEKWQEAELSFTEAGIIQIQHRSSSDSLICSRLGVIQAQLAQGNITGLMEFSEILDSLDSRTSVPSEIEELVNGVKHQMESMPLRPPMPSHADVEEDEASRKQTVAPIEN